MRFGLASRAVIAGILDSRLFCGAAGVAGLFCVLEVAGVIGVATNGLSVLAERRIFRRHGARTEAA